METTLTNPIPRLRTLIALTGLVLPWLALALPVAACSCVAFEGFGSVADREHAVVVGRAVARQGDGTTIQVERWLWGPGAGPILDVREATPETDMCALGSVAPLGEPWMWVAWIPANDRPVVNSCLPSWSLNDPEGAARFDEAVATFGLAPLPTSEGSSGGPERAPGPDASPLAAGVLAVAAGIVVLGGAALVARRQGARSPDRPPGR